MGKGKKITHGKGRYRRGVGAVLFNVQGRVLVAERIDAPGAWQFPQGGVKKGEKLRRAVLRELAEEIGTDKVEIIAKSRHWLRYDLPADTAGRVWGGKYKGQEQRWFALRFMGTDADIDINATSHPEFRAWKWVNLEDIPRFIVPFKRSLYETLVTEFCHLADA